MRRGVLAAALLLAACTVQKPPAGPPPMHLSRTAFGQLPGWQDEGAQTALASFQRGCAVLMQRPDTAPMGGAGYAGTVGDWRAVCAKANGDAKSFFTQNFTPYAVTGDGLSDDTTHVRFIGRIAAHRNGLAAFANNDVGRCLRSLLDPVHAHDG